MGSIFRTEGLSAGYGRKVVLSGAEITAERGRITTLIGPNGCGKSTLLRTAAKQLEPLAGTVFISGKSLRETGANELARKLSILLTDRVSPELMTCRDVVSTGRYPYTGHLGVLRPEDKAIVEQSLRETDALDFADRPFQSISDGQRQRVLLARALCQQPELIVLDEPTAMLDPQGRREVIETVERLNREEGMTVVLITHHMDEATHAGRVVAMNDGKIVADGTPAEVFSQVELLRSVGLSVPETTELLYALRADGFDLPLDALSIDQCAQALYDRIKA